jgi:2-polyprenyl-3-methyl-5-hydroxy-6-metoxy-1,4-benzoquinol methylase
MRQAARTNLADFPNVTIATPEELDRGAFDFILCSSVIEYVEDDGDFLRRLAALLAPRGRLLVTFPRRWGPLQVLNRWILKRFQADSYARYQQHTYTEKIVRRMAVDAGLRCEVLIPGVRLLPFLPAGIGEQVSVVMGKA